VKYMGKDCDVYQNWLFEKAVELTACVIYEKEQYQMYKNTLM
jgi:hypothetical protein